MKIISKKKIKRPGQANSINYFLGDSILFDYPPNTVKSNNIQQTRRHQNPIALLNTIYIYIFT